MFGLGVKVPAITAKDLVEQLKQDCPPVVIDVRTLAEFRTGHISGAHLIPLSELARRLDEIPKDRPVVTVCRSGSRSQIAAKQLIKKGYDVCNLVGGMVRWSGKTVR